MNIAEKDILIAVKESTFKSQRQISEITKHSLGIVNRSINNLISKGYLDKNKNITEKANIELEDNTPKRAIILAAGYGLRMIPINTETPKAFVKINSEYLIERQIRQLHEVGIKEIYIVVGFMKERFEYLIDNFGVELIVNPEYSVKNNLCSLKLASDHIEDTYIIPCDVWCRKNLFRRHELYSWYTVTDAEDIISDVKVNRKNQLVRVDKSQYGNAMLGISYIRGDDSKVLRERLIALSYDRTYDDSFWEEALYIKNQMSVYARVIPSTDAVEINTYDQLRKLDRNSESLISDTITALADAMGVTPDDISDIKTLKKGMTNSSFLFSCHGIKYITKIPEENREIINHGHEADVYKTIKGLGLSPDIIYIDLKSGFKISPYLENTRPCDAYSERDITECMNFLHKFHDMSLSVGHNFDPWKKIELYESMWNGEASAYRDYSLTKSHVLSLKGYIDKHIESKVLSHNDPVPDNFLFYTDEHGTEKLQLIDWEYAGMQDPHMDIAMFAVYSLYDRQHIDKLIDIYFDNGCPKETRIKIYCYISVCGLIWSNWCEYKMKNGSEFGEYSLRQYRYAKEYYRIALDEIAKLQLE